METQPKLAVIGGSGVYEMPGLEDIQEFDLDTPFGKPSAPVIVGTLEGVRMAFLARHGIGHFISPSELNFRANIYALKSLGVERVISINACGSLREDFAPGEIVIPDQLFDFTRDRKRTFFEGGLVAHIGVADPVCPDLSQQLLAAVRSAGAAVHAGGSFIIIEGPRFSTRAESKTYRQWGMAIIGMTAVPEAFLAREAELCYAIMAHVTDYDVWHTSEKPVSVEAVIKVLQHNAQVAQESVRQLARKLNFQRTCECESALENALITRRDRIPMETHQRLGLLIEKYIS